MELKNSKEFLMSAVPVSYFCMFVHEPEHIRRFLLQDLGEAGAKNLVLSHEILAKIAGDPGFADVLLKEVTDAGLTFCDAHSPFGAHWDMNCPYPAIRKQMFAFHKLILEICAYMKVDTITIHVGNNHFSPANNYPLEQNICWIKETLAELLPVAEKLGITICIENIWFPTNTPEILLDIKSCFPTENLGLCYDAGHANLMNKGRFDENSFPNNDWAAAGMPGPKWDDQILEKMLPHIVNCHLHDNWGVRDEHNLPGCGNVDWKHIMPTLLSAPRLKVIQGEICPLSKGVPFWKLVQTFNELLQMK